MYMYTYVVQVLYVYNPLGILVRYSNDVLVQAVMPRLRYSGYVRVHPVRHPCTLFR